MGLNFYDDAVEQLADDQPNPYDAVVRRRQTSADVRLRAGLQLAGEQSPDDAAEAQRLATRFGVPPSVVERNLASFRQRAQLDDTAPVSRDTPALASWLTDPSNAAIAHDDMEQLRSIEHTLTFGKSILRGVDQAQGLAWGFGEAVMEAAGERQIARDFGRRRAANAREADAYGTRTSITALRGPWDLAQWAKETIGEQIPIMTPILASAGAGAAIGSVVPGIGTTLGATIGAFIPALAMGVGEVQGTIKAIDPTAEVPAAAFIGGTAIAALDSVLPGRIGGRLVQTFGRDTAEAIAKRALLQPVHPRYLRQVAGGMSTEGLTEALQEAIGAVAAAAGTDTAVPSDVWAQMVDAGAAGALVGGVVTGGEAAVTRRRDQARVAAAQQNKVLFDALAQGVTESKLYQRLPAKAQEFIARVTKDGPIETVFAPLDTWTTYWQSKGINPALMAAEVTGRVDAFEQATRTGEDLAIPTSAYAVKLAATEHHGYFAQELRLGPEQMNAREAQAFESELAAAPAADTATPPTPVRDAIVAQLEAAGESRASAEAYATLYDQVFAALGERAGVDPMALFQRYSLQVVREGLGTRSDAVADPSEAPAGIPASEAQPNETPTQRGVRRQAHVAALVSFLTRDAQRLDPSVDPEMIRSQVEARIDLHADRQAAQHESGRGQDLLRAIADAGGVWWETRTGAYKGEIEHLLESRDIAGVKAGSGRVVHNKGRATWNGVAGVFREDGKTPDGIVEALGRQEARFAYIEDINVLWEAIDEALRAEPDVDAFPGTDELGIKPGTAWWFRGSRREDRELDDDTQLDAVEPADGGDASFEFFQRRDDGKRGAIRFGPDGRVLIELFTQENRSTFLHETGHFYLRVLSDLVEQVGAADPATLTATQRQLLADVDALGQWLGATGLRDLTEEQHEQFARGFEAYLMEGKAPSLELRAAFARFRAWLVGVYRTVRNLQVEISDDVRAVFDRLVATDAAIEAAEQEAKIAPLFTDAQSAGMTELEFASYQDQVREASARAREELQARLLAELKREEFAWWKAERDAIRVEVEADVHARPVYIAMSGLRTGTYPDGRPLPMFEGGDPQPVKLSRESLVKQYGKEILAKLPRPYLYAKDSGISADAAAELFGYSSGDELLQALMAAQPMRQAIDAEVEDRMFAKHGDLMRDGRLEELARRAVEGEHRATVVQAELKALTKGMVRATIPSADSINAAAARRIASTRIRDIRPGTFLQASRRAARQAFELLATGQDRAGAVRAKQQELVNLALYREARDARERVESIRRTLQAYGSTPARQRFGKAGADYLAQIDGFLDRYELARVSQKDLDRRTKLDAFVKQLEAEGLPVEIPASLLDDSRRVNYQDITLEEFVGVYEAVEHIAHLARLKNALLTSAKKRTFEEERNALVDSVRLHNVAKPQPLEFRPADEKRRGVGEWFASHSKIGMLARALDGHEDGGEFWEAIIRPINAAAEAEDTRKADAGRQLRALLTEAYPGRELGTLNHKMYIPALNASLSKEGRLAVALNWGNEGNRARLLADRTRKWSSAQVDAILDTLDERDWRFVQGVWDYIDTFWPEIAEKQRRVTGLAPEKVEASPVHTRFGEFRGGYYPIAYDGRLVGRAATFQKGGEVTLAALAGYVRATTRRGHTEARVENVKSSVRLELGVAFQHVEQVIHDLTHHEMLIDVNRLVGDPDVQAAILETKGDHVYAQFPSALQDIALGPAPAKGILEKSAAFMRAGTQIALLGWSFWTGVQQPIGLANGAQRVGVRWVARGLKRWLRDAVSMENTVGWIHGKSPAMANRHTNATQDLADLRRALAQPGGWFDVLVRTVSRDHVTQQDILDSFLWHIGLMQRVADVPTWLGAYEKAMASDPADEARAVALADQAVIDSQGSGSIKDLAQVQRGTPVAKLFMTFYSYGNTLFNSTSDAVGRARGQGRRVGSVGMFLGGLSLLYVVPAVWTVALSRATGRTDDDEPFVLEVGREILATALNTVVLVRELTGLLGDGVRGYAGPAGARTLQQVYRFANQAKQGEVDEALVRAGGELAGVLFRFPAAQIQRSVDGFVAIQEGRTRNPFALLVGPTKE